MKTTYNDKWVNNIWRFERKEEKMYDYQCKVYQNSAIQLKMAELERLMRLKYGSNNNIMQMKIKSLLQLIDGK